MCCHGYVRVDSVVLMYLAISVRLLVSETEAAAWTKFERNSALDNYTCASADTVIAAEVLNTPMCALTCMQESTCLTIFYNSQSGHCSGCSSIYTVSSVYNAINPPQVAVGYRHYQKTVRTCENGWTRFMDSCYRLSPSGTFLEGVAVCNASAAHAVYIETEEENDFIKASLNTTDVSNTYWFMGMTDNAENGVWRYYGTDELVQYTDFHSTEPNDDGTNSQTCAILYSLYGFNFQWADHFCEDIVPTICEKGLQ